MASNEIFIANPNRVVTDTRNKCEWLPNDTWIDLGKWVNWDEANSYILTMRNVYAGGHQNWRLPTKDEAIALYDEDLKILDWEGENIHIAPHFTPKCGRVIWTSDVDEEGKACAVNIQDGTAEYVDKSTSEHYSARLIRDPEPPSPAP